MIISSNAVGDWRPTQIIVSLWLRQWQSKDSTPGLSHSWHGALSLRTALWLLRPLHFCSAQLLEMNKPTLDLGINGGTGSPNLYGLS